ncbi:MAG: protein-glutamate O-methyltransferase CheR [Magnetococcus sp. WYHC-3]
MAGFSLDHAPLDDATFQHFCDLIYDKAGIKLGSGKQSLVEARLGKRMRKLGIGSYREYLQLIEHDDSGDEVIEMLDAISTNTTHFFRESEHFDRLRQFLQTCEAEGQRRFRIWCAASSTGEEPYTIAMTVCEALASTQDVRILATDISTKVLRLASQGVYTHKQVSSIPSPHLAKYFNRQQDRRTDEPHYAANESLRSLLTFARLNLATPPYPMKGPFDVILCRNVMIYFDNAVRSRLLAECERLLRPGGILIVGHAESLSGMLTGLHRLEPSVYVKK